MRLSQLFTKTSKESQADSSSANADLLTRAGFVHKTMAGVYSYLPLGWRVLRKIEQILREEMDKIGSELFLSALSPRENWAKTGRLESVDVLFQAGPANDGSKRKNDAAYILNSTHEEVITPIVQQFVASYKDLPCATYQIQTKFRNEARPKSGILRGREFRMKDLYSFHASEEDMTTYYFTKAIPAYTAFFERVGLGEGRTIIALASGGDFSKEPSREFQTKCETGEDHIFHVPGSETYFNREITPSKAKPWVNAQEPEKQREDVLGKGIIGVTELAAFFKIEVERTTKTLLFETDGGKLVAIAVRGDYDVSEEKVRKILGTKTLKLASLDTVRKETKAEVGYAGPIGLPTDVRVLWDDSTAGRKNFECGANKTDYHSLNVNFGRDVDEPAEFFDLKTAKEGDLDPESGQPYDVFKASEVGNIYTLYRKYTDAFDFTFKDKDGKDKPVYMGCYGIGTTRTMGVLAEVYHDEKGLTWPAQIAPAICHIIPIAKTADEEAMTEAVSLYDALQAHGIECLLDDRINDTVGSKLADADLIGCPWRIIVSPKTLKEGQAEVKARTATEAQMLSLQDCRSGTFVGGKKR